MKKLVNMILICTLILCLGTVYAEDNGIVHRDIAVESANGLTLRGYLEGPRSVIEGNDRHPLIILMHGLMDSGEFELIRKQADAYTAAGYAVLAVDFNGHGKSDGKVIDMTISKELQDGEAILAYAKQLSFVSQIYLIGHSQGGVIASITAARHSKDIDRLVLLAPGGMLADRFRAGTCFGTEFDPADPPEKVMVFDDYVGREYIIDAMKMDLYDLAKGFSGHPVLLIAGESDPLVKEEVVRRYEEIYSDPQFGNRVDFAVIKDAPHDFAGHEDELTSIVLNWMEEK